MELLHIENLTFRYPDTDKNALDGISLSISEGSFNVVCGESGSGKTTLLRLIKRELAPNGEESGIILFNGINIASADSNIPSSDIGFVLQDPESQIVTDTVWRELALGLENLGTPPEQIRRRTAETACYFGLDGLYRSNTDILSGGQKQLLALASVTVMRPQIIILDEPTSRLDPISASAFINALVKLNRELGITVIISEHRLEELFTIADRIIAIENGRIIANAPPTDAAIILCNTPDRKMINALPCALRVYRGIGRTGIPPLSVKDGRKLVRSLTVAGKVRTSITSFADISSSGNKGYAAELDCVSFRYQKELPDVLRNASLRVNCGEILFLLGGNGVGKTTVLRLLSGLNRPYRGNVKIFGKSAKKYGSKLYKECISYLPQDPKTVFFADTVQDDLIMTLNAVGTPSSEINAEIEKVCNATGITELMRRHPYDLSGGEMQKCAIAKMLLSHPRLLLLDEPTKGLDAYSKQQLKELLKNLSHIGITVIAVTHDTEFAAECGDRCAMVFDSNIFSPTSPEKFFSGNSFYTTAAVRMSQGMLEGTVTCDSLISALCETEGKS